MEDFTQKKKRPALSAVFRTVYESQKIRPQTTDDFIKQLREEKLRMKLWCPTDVQGEGKKTKAKYHTVKFNSRKYGSVKTNITSRMDDHVAGKVIDEFGFDPNGHIRFDQEVSVSRF